MIMDKLSMDEEDSGALHNVESFVLDRLLTQQSSASVHSISMGVLTESLDIAMSPLFDQAIEDLVAQSLIHSEDGENFQITKDGINELENRKREAIPL
jgi:predicted transcriptional regulator